MRRRGSVRALATILAGGFLLAGCATRMHRNAAAEGASQPPSTPGASPVSLSLLEQLGGGHAASAPLASPAVSTALGRLWLGAAWYPEQWPQ
ncbi:MAG: hypothetical protein ACRET2_14155, partial [Steroidobacteraceae bacterium]